MDALLARNQLRVNRVVMQVLNQWNQVGERFAAAGFGLEHDIISRENAWDGSLLDVGQSVVFVHLQDSLQLRVDGQVCELVAREHVRRLHLDHWFMLDFFRLGFGQRRLCLLVPMVHFLLGCRLCFRDCMLDLLLCFRDPSCRCVLWTVCCLFIYGLKRWLRALEFWL